MKSSKIVFVIALSILGFFASCSKKNKDPKQIIAGESSKTWKASKETTASGKDDVLTDAEKQESMQFYTSGNLVINGMDDANAGSWSYDDGSKNLSLKFTNASVTENFSVLSLEDGEMKLKASDGSTMVLKSE